MKKGLGEVGAFVETAKVEIREATQVTNRWGGTAAKESAAKAAGQEVSTIEHGAHPPAGPNYMKRAAIGAAIGAGVGYLMGEEGNKGSAMGWGAGIGAAANVALGAMFGGRGVPSPQAALTTESLMAGARAAHL
jgi:hypothetical protein